MVKRLRLNTQQELSEKESMTIKHIAALIGLILCAASPTLALVKCPVGQAVRYSETGVIEFKANWEGGSGTCRVLNPKILQNKSLKIMGCSGTESSQLTIMMPAGVKHNCPKYVKPVMTILAANFTLASEEKNDRPVEAAPSTVVARSRKLTPSNTDMATQVDMAGSKAVENEGDDLGNLVENLRYKGTGIKQSDEVDRYTQCLLDTGKEAKKNNPAYSKEYASHLSEAATQFGAPSFLLKCNCGRETLFDKSSKNEKGAAGICQATDIFIEEMNNRLNGCITNMKKKKVCTPERAIDLRSRWKQYVDRTATSKSCQAVLNASGWYKLNASGFYNLTKDMILACPALGLGAAGVDMGIAANRLEHQAGDSRDESWKKAALAGYAALAGSYNVGPPFVQRAVAGISDPKKWPAAIVKDICARWPGSPSERGNKLRETRSHMASIRNCMQEDNYLDHEGNQLSNSPGAMCVNDATSVAARNSAEDSSIDFEKTLDDYCPGEDMTAVKAWRADRARVRRTRSYDYPSSVPLPQQGLDGGGT